MISVLEPQLQKYDLLFMHIIYTLNVNRLQVYTLCEGVATEHNSRLRTSKFKNTPESYAGRLGKFYRKIFFGISPLKS